MNRIKAMGLFRLDAKQVWAISAKRCLTILMLSALPVTCMQWSAAQGTRFEETGSRTILTLEQAVENALARNPSLQAVMANAAFAEGEVESARERPNPTFATEFETTGSGYQDFAIYLEQEWETAGKRRYRTLVAEEHVQRAQYQIENARRLLVEEVKLAYLEVLRVQSLQRICREFGELLEEFLQFNELLIQEGEVPHINAEMVQLEFDGMANERLLYEMRLEISKAQLAQLVGMPLDFPFTVESESLKSPGDLPSQEELLNFSLQHRPDLKLLESELKAADHQLSLEVARSKPNLMIGADFHRQREELGESVRGSFSAIGFHFTVPIPVFDRNHGAIIRATATRSSLRQQRAAAGRAIQKEVLVEIEKYTFAAQVSKLNSDRIVRTQRSAKALYGGYVLGAAGITDVLGLQRSVYELKKGYALAEFERTSAWVRLEASLGGEVAQSRLW